MKTVAEQIRELACNIVGACSSNVPLDEKIEYVSNKLVSLADHLESEPSGGLREQMENLATTCDTYPAAHPDEAFSQGFVHGLKSAAVDMRRVLAATPKPPESAEPGSEGVVCPFCKEDDFDLIGLRNHLMTGECKDFDNTPTIAQLHAMFLQTRPAEVKDKRDGK